MQRVRMSLQYFSSFGWEAEIVTVDESHSDINKDYYLLESIPDEIPVHTVNAFSKKITSKLGLGSIALRSLYFFKREVDKLLKEKNFDLIYFSTTQYPVCILGNYWKRKHHIPYVIDLQDPWHSEYYQDKQKSQRPPKYWFSYRLNKFLEPIAMARVDGLISVSQAYIETLKQRYPILKSTPSAVITFGAFEKDFEIAQKYKEELKSAVDKKQGEISIIYVGRGGLDMQPAVSIFFEAFKEGLLQYPEVFERYKVYFIGTSYASAGAGTSTIKPIADQFGLNDYVNEQTDRISFYRTLNTLKSADVLFIPGSDDPQYTASKIYPYLMAARPLISIFHHKSSAAKIIEECEVGLPLTFAMDRQEMRKKIKIYLTMVASGLVSGTYPKSVVFNNYSAKNMTKMQVELFNEAIQQK